MVYKTVYSDMAPAVGAAVERIRQIFVTDCAPLLEAHRSLVQVALDTLSDLTGVGLMLVTAPDIHRIFSRLEATVPDYHHRVESADDLRSLVELASKDPIRLFQTICADLRQWRPIFDQIEAEFVLFRSGRIDPILRLLRDHWAWKWVEVLALLGRLALPEIADPGTDFYKGFTRGIWNITCVPIWGLEPGAFIVIGPTRRPPVDSPNSAAVIRQLIEEFYRIVRSGRSLIAADPHTEHRIPFQSPQ
jgi:hypothetical protein